MNPAGCGAAGRQDGSRPPGMLGTSSVIRKCIDGMQNPTYLVHLGPAHHAPGPAPSCGAPTSTQHAQGVREAPQVLPSEQGFAIYTPGWESLPVAHTHTTSPRTHRSAHTALPRTHTCLGAAPAGLGEDVWARKLGCLYFPLASFLQLAPRATGREPEPPSSHTSNTHTHGAGSLHAPSSRANAKSCLGG